jgi:hypothetical protein
MPMNGDAGPVMFCLPSSESSTYGAKGTVLSVSCILVQGNVNGHMYYPLQVKNRKEFTV